LEQKNFAEVPWHHFFLKKKPIALEQANNSNVWGQAEITRVPGFHPASASGYHLCNSFYAEAINCANCPGSLS